MVGVIDQYPTGLAGSMVRIALGRINLIPRGQGRCFSVGRFRVAVFRQRDDSVRALANACPHRGGPLADGVIGANLVVCPLHAHSFRLTDGSGVDSDLCVQTFPVEICDGTILIEIPTDA
jgi:nitrite reductase (NADH) small subunit